MEYGLPIGVLSYGWCGRSHPDEQGVHLQRLIPLLEAIVRECDCVGPEFTWGILWDFASLPQRGYSKGFDAAQDDRSDLEVGRFRSGLFNINEWYAARFTHVFVLDGPMPQGSLNMREPFVASGFGEEESGRGWCIFERRLSSLIKDQGCYLQLSGMSEEMLDWELIRERCKASRPSPMSPEMFADMFARGHRLHTNQETHIDQGRESQTKYKTKKTKTKKARQQGKKRTEPRENNRTKNRIMTQTTMKTQSKIQIRSSSKLNLKRKTNN